MSTNDGGPAFPVIPPLDKGSSASAFCYPYPDAGMTLRDYFAAKAMQGICASDIGQNMTSGRIVSGSYEISDAMLKAREGGAS